MKGIVYQEATIKSALHRHSLIDNWFPVRYSVNPYSGCEYGCCYCRVNWKLPKTVIIKNNILEILERELRDLTFPQLIGVGGGFNDVFAPINREQKLSDQVISQIIRAGHRPLVMTKNPSYIIKETIKDWSSYPENIRPIVLTSFSSPIGSGNFGKGKASLEPHTPTFRDRFSSLTRLSRYLPTGAAFLPWISSDQGLSVIMEEGARQGWSFTLLGFSDHISNENYSLPKMPIVKRQKIQADYQDLSRKLRLWPRLPHRFFSGRLSPKDEITVLLAYHYYFGDSEEKNSFRLSSYGINCLSESEFERLLFTGHLEKIKGVGPVISGIIKDFISYGNIDYFKKRWRQWGYNE